MDGQTDPHIDYSSQLRVVQFIKEINVIQHARIQEFLPGGGGVQAQLPENSSDDVFFIIILVHNIFYSFAVVYQWFISKKTIIFKGFRRCPTFSRGGGGSNIFQGGWGSNFFQGGLNANLYRNPKNL